MAGAQLRGLSISISYKEGGVRQLPRKTEKQGREEQCTRPKYEVCCPDEEGPLFPLGNAEPWKVLCTEMRAIPFSPWLSSACPQRGIPAPVPGSAVVPSTLLRGSGPLLVVMADSRGALTMSALTTAHV